MWLNKTEIEQWRNNPYPNSVDAQPTIHYDNDLTIKESITYGMFYDNLYSYVRLIIVLYNIFLI